MKHTNNKKLNKTNKNRKNKKRLNKNTKRGGGNNNVVSVNVKPLNELLEYLVNDKTTNENGKIQFEAFITIQLKKPLTRNERYDITVLCAVMNIMFDYKQAVQYTYHDNKNELKETNANNLNIKCCNETLLDKDKNEVKLGFFIEDMYCEDLNKFIEEYDNFMKDETYTSRFFYESNIANIALLFKCYYNRCFDDYLKIYKKKIIKENFIDTVFKTFKDNKDLLLKQLVKAYNSCYYNDIIDLYTKFLTFYKNSMAPNLKGTYNRVDIANPIIKTIQDTKKNVYPPSTNTKIVKTIETNSHSNDYFIYLSCTHAIEYKQARLYMTRFIDSYIGQGNKIHNGIYFDSISVIQHDFDIHENLRRIKDTKPDTYDNINKKWIIKLYNDWKEKNINVYKYGMYVLQIIQNERNKENNIVCNDDFYKLFMGNINDEYEIINKPENKKSSFSFFYSKEVIKQFNNIKSSNNINDNSIEYTQKMINDFIKWVIPEKHSFTSEYEEEFFGMKITIT